MTEPIDDTPHQQDAPARHEAPRQQRGLRSTILAALIGVAVVVTVLGVIMWLTSASDPEPQAHPNQDTAGDAPLDVDLAGLTESSTYTAFDDAPADDDPFEATDGRLVHPLTETAVFDAPHGEPFAKIGPEQIGVTWLPVLDEADGWVEVLLPSKPNGSTGWLHPQDLHFDQTPYEIRVHLESMQLELFNDGQSVGSWTIGKGKPDTPTPTGRTFLLGSFTDQAQQFSPVILPLGVHSPTLDTYGGGPGTVAIHTWPTDDVYGTASSDGCIRIPPDALDELTEVPLGTLVLIDNA